MPIKFRCEYCRQLMGIAEAKAGSLVDCPTCGRTLRVPNRDGTVDLPPQPAVNLADDGLRRALDELAQIGRSDPKMPHVQKRPVPINQAPAPSSQAPQTEQQIEAKLAPARVEAAAPATAVPPNPLVNAVALEPLPPMKVVDPPAAVTAPVSPGQPTAAAATIAEPTSKEVLAALAARSTPANVSAPVTAPVLASHGVPVWLVVLISLLCLLIGFIVGFELGRYLDHTPAGAVGQPDASAAASPDVARSQVKGRLTFRNAQKQLQPDAGACVLLLPATHQGEKLAAVGFRPNDDDESHQAAGKLLSKLGGRFVQADDDGNFQIELPDGDEFTIVALSHYHRATEDDERVAETLKGLAEHFERPDQLVGMLAVHAAPLKRSGSSTLIFDYAFGD